MLIKSMLVLLKNSDLDYVTSLKQLQLVMLKQQYGDALKLPRLTMGYSQLMGYDNNIEARMMMI